MPKQKPALAPLAPGQTQPMTWAAVGELKRLREGPVPRQAILPDFAARFLAAGYARPLDLPSPFAIHGGRALPHLEITATGRAVVDALMPATPA